jgi:AraC family transcriptional regulator, arabinose operon regulatory protein
MFQVPEKYYKNDTVHRSLNADNTNGLLTCGFLNKRKEDKYDVNITFKHYGVLLVLDGTGSHIDNEGNEYKLYPGCLVQRVPNKPHSTYVHGDDKWLEFFICFGKELFEALANIGILSSNDVLYPGVNRSIFRTLIEFLSLMKSSEDRDLPFLLCKAQKILFLLYYMHIDNSTKNGDKEIIRKACFLLSENPATDVSVQEICRELGIGYEKFRKIFKDHTGISPGSYVIHKRINKAKSMLIEEGKTVKEISLSLGYTNPFVFSKQFRRITGMSPTEFKEKR